MSIYKRGDVYWYKFMWKGEVVRESTKQGNDKVARQMEAAHRTSLAKGEVGIRDKKPSLTLGAFAKLQFMPWAEATFAAKPKTWLWYRNGVRRLLACREIAESNIDQLAGEQVAGYVARRQSEGLLVSSINRELQVLRRMLRLALEWGVVERVAKVRMISGEQHREFVLTSEEEARYLAAAPEPLASIATVLADTGFRPEECYRMRWEGITWVNGRNGTLLVTHGKTAAARRVLPMTQRVRVILETRWEAAGRPLEGWVWTAPTHSGHVEASSLKKQHNKAVRLSKVRTFVLYSMRHTFLTRVGESGCDVWTLARIAGHSSIAISARYVHPSEDAVLTAISRLGGHNSGHSAISSGEEKNGGRLLTQAAGTK
ncbi:MAG: site-specific integrase [Candidatus Korobacteraceae bacterium]|jgi:integrase